MQMTDKERDIIARAKAIREEIDRLYKELSGLKRLCEHKHGWDRHVYFEEAIPKGVIMCSSYTQCKICGISKTTVEDRI
jgi:hypothetical protein